MNFEIYRRKYLIGISFYRSDTLVIEDKSDKDFNEKFLKVEGAIQNIAQFQVKDNYLLVASSNCSLNLFKIIEKLEIFCVDQISKIQVPINIFDFMSVSNDLVFVFGTDNIAFLDFKTLNLIFLWTNYNFEKILSFELLKYRLKKGGLLYRMFFKYYKKKTKTVTFKILTLDENFMKLSSKAKNIIKPQQILSNIIKKLELKPANTEKKIFLKSKENKIKEKQSDKLNDKKKPDKQKINKDKATVIKVNTSFIKKKISKKKINTFVNKKKNQTNNLDQLLTKETFHKENMKDYEDLQIKYFQEQKKNRELKEDNYALKIEKKQLKSDLEKIINENTELRQEMSTISFRFEKCKNKFIIEKNKLIDHLKRLQSEFFILKKEHLSLQQSKVNLFNQEKLFTSTPVSNNEKKELEKNFNEQLSEYKKDLKIKDLIIEQLEMEKDTLQTKIKQFSNQESINKEKSSLNFNSTIISDKAPSNITFNPEKINNFENVDFFLN